MDEIGSKFPFVAPPPLHEFIADLKERRISFRLVSSIKSSGGVTFREFEECRRFRPFPGGWESSEKQCIDCRRTGKVTNHENRKGIISVVSLVRNMRSIKEIQVRFFSLFRSPTLPL